MSGTTVIAMGAITAAREAQVAACKLGMPLFNGATASIEQSKAYARCVELLYPIDAFTPFQTIAIKVLIASSLIGMGIGAWNAYRDKWHRTDLEPYVMNVFMGAIAGPVAVLFLAGLWVGVKFLLT